MNRQELLHTHALLSRIRYYFEYETDDVDVPDGAFEEYHEIGTTAINLDDEKENHKKAIKTLGQSLQRLCTPSVSEFDTEDEASTSEEPATPVEPATAEQEDNRTAEAPGETADDSLDDLKNLVAEAEAATAQADSGSPGENTTDDSLSEYGVTVDTESPGENNSPYGDQDDGTVSAAGETETATTTNDLWEYAGQAAPEPSTAASEQSSEPARDQDSPSQEDTSLADFADG